MRWSRLVRFATKIGTEDSGIRIGSQIGLYIVNQTAALAQGKVQTAIHAGTAKDIVQQIKCGTLVIVCIIPPATYHHMGLMGIFMHDKPFRDIKGRRRTAIVDRHSGHVGKKPLCQTDNRIDIQSPPYEKNHISRMIETGSKSRGVLATESFQMFRITQDVTSQRMSAENHILEIVENKFGRVIFVRLYFINNHIRFFFNLTLRKRGVKYNIYQ